MVTAPAPAVPVPQTQPPASAGAIANPTLPQISFDSIFQNLPILPDVSEAIPVSPSAAIGKSASQPPVTKDLGSKKDPSKRSSDSLAAIANFAAVPLDSAPKQPKLAASLTLSLTTEPSLAEAHGALIAQNGTLDLVAPEAFPKPAVVSTLQQSVDYAAASLTKSPALTVSQQQPTISTFAALPNSPQESSTFPPNSSAPATAADAAVNATPVRRTAIRQPAFDSQAMATAPTSVLGAPLALAEQQKITATTAPALPEPAADVTRRSATEASSHMAVDPPLISKDLVASLAPKNENLAFSLHMLDTTTQRGQTATPQPAGARTQPASPTKSVERPLPSAPPAIPTRAPQQEIDGATMARTASSVWNDAAAAPQLNLHSTGLQFSEPRLSVNPSSVAAMHEAQQLLPEPVKPNSTSEILLQLGGKDQPAAIRVSERGGAVNVSVHAADPELRTSLRSSLGELASQLSHQGWKTDVVKSGTLVPRAETSQDFRQDGQRSSSQQQPSAHGERQPQRDRRSNSGQWLAEFEEQSTGNAGNRGGTNS